MVTVNLAIAASTDDATQSGAVVNLIATFSVIVDAVNEFIGLRFQNVTVPQGTTIDSAILSVLISSSAQDEPQHTIYGEASDNAVTFADASPDKPAERVPTTATVLWDVLDLGADGLTYFSPPDLKDIVQEIVNRAGWVSGNSLVIMIQGGADPDRELVITMWDNADPTMYAKLDITYSAGIRSSRTTGHKIRYRGPVYIKTSKFQRLIRRRRLAS